MRLAIVLSLLSCSLVAIASSAEQLYRCNGIYQNFPCPAGARQERINPRPIGRTAGGEAPRARFRPESRISTEEERAALDDLTKAPLRKTAPGPVNSQRKQANVAQLADTARALRSGVRETVRREGAQAALREVVRNRVALDRLCTGARSALDADTKARCAAADHDNTQAEREITEAVKQDAAQ